MILLNWVGELALLIGDVLELVFDLDLANGCHYLRKIF